MQLKNLGLLLGGAALAGMLLAACDGLPGDEGCTTDADCTGTGEVCHLGAKVCVATCEMGSDCPDEEKTCAAAPWTGAGTTKICQCSTDALCGRAVTGEVCSATYKICTAGQSTDGGMNPTTCNSANPQPAACAYGSYCASNACAAVTAPTCGNFTSTSPAKSWSATSSTGPVIYTASDESADDAAFCQTGTFSYTTIVQAYRSDADWPAQLTAIPSFRYVKTDGSEANGAASMRPSGYTPNGRTASFKVTLCSESGGIIAGFYFSGGNGVCVALSQGTAGTGT